jgi:hypothetical protein
MESALNEYLSASQLDCFFNFFEEITPLYKVRLRVVLIFSVWTEPAFVNADICIIDIPVHNKSDNAFRMQVSPRAICHPAEFKQITLPEQPQAFFSCNMVIVFHF